MTGSRGDFVTLGADVGGKDAFSATNQHVLALRSLLRQEFSNVSGGGLKEIALVIRVDGAVQAWGKSGIENIAFQKKKSFVTADIFIPVDAWSSGDSSSFRRFLVDQVVCAIRLVVEEVSRHGVTCDRDVLETSLENVRQQYLD